MKNLGIGLFFFFFTVAAVANDVDKRQIVPLSEHQRDHILSEMRALLAGTRNILDALSRDEMATVAREARALGLGMAGKGENHLRSVLPEAFMRLGMSVHKDFDNISLDAQSIKDPRHTLRQLSEAMKKCDSCHASYQIRINEDAAAAETPPLQQRHHHSH
ncbi:hypothetical protein [Nitrosospira sp. Is2]|uniref:hypothetical protein n=1 Tax=Nitrosospira sp. Is2 TaxID=3080532 RepID=UPI0029537BF1|nr:hypothetical protein [Nitrosospira sp. Is2]WON74505.1 hypothetical protein R5L00_03170 [Nitrosospira sp. Is2]